jgi:hypothetical protein
MNSFYDINKGGHFQDLNYASHQPEVTVTGIDTLQNTGNNYVTTNDQSYATLMNNLKKLQQQQLSNDSNAILAKQSKSQGILDGKMQDSAMYMTHVNNFQIVSILFASTLLIGGIIWYNTKKD